MRCFEKLTAVLLFSCALASSTAARAIAPGELSPGDVVLNPLRCFVCEAIEREENSIYSHSGVIVRDELGELRVAQALSGQVGMVPVSEFRRYTQRGQSIRVVRTRELAGLSTAERDERSHELLRVFRARFEGLPIDSAFLWNNTDEHGRELLYCSEFVAKLLGSILSEGFQTKPMHYDRVASFWQDYFRGSVPVGLPGMSPGDFLLSPLTLDMGDLD